MSAARRLKILLHAQHLSGVGHYVRTFEIARTLAEFHEVHLIEGGRPVPRAAATTAPPPLEGGQVVPSAAATTASPPSFRARPSGRDPESSPRAASPAMVPAFGQAHPFERFALPPVVRGSAGLAALDGGSDIQQVLQERVRRLREYIMLIRPDVFMVEHFPFSKWELADEILAGIESIRRVNRHARVLCSLRDIAPQTRHERVPAEDYRRRVLDLLEKHFDAVLVHGDPQLARPEDHFPELAASGIPIHYTGIVSEKVTAAINNDAIAAQRPFVLVSVGGGSGDAGFVDRCLDAWTLLRDRGVTGDRRMLLFAGLGWGEERLAALQLHAAGAGAELQAFTPDFLGWLAAADLAVTHAGYNTCTNILETGVRALLVPDPQMSDQAMRARKLAERGIVDTIAPDSLSVETLAAAIEKALARPAPHHDISLDGAAETRRIIESLAAVSA